MESFHGPPIETKMGDIQQGFRQSEKIVEGELEMGGQLHFYMETHRSLVVPRDGGELEIFAGAQNPTSAQVMIIELCIYISLLGLIGSFIFCERCDRAEKTYEPCLSPDFQVS